MSYHLYNKFQHLLVLLLDIFVCCKLIEYELVGAQNFTKDQHRHKRSDLSDNIFSGYHHYQETADLFHELADRYPNTVEYGSIGQSVEKRELFYLQLTKDISSPATYSRPKVKLVGNMHGDETIGRENIIYLAMFLLNNQDNERCQAILENMRLYLMPSLNPDGFEKSTEGMCDFSKGRNNADGIDINRDFPDQFVKQSGLRHHAVETSAMMNWITENKYV